MRHTWEVGSLPRRVSCVRIGARTLAILSLASVLAAAVWLPSQSAQFLAAVISTLRPELMLMVAIGLVSWFDYRQSHMVSGVDLNQIGLKIGKWES